MRTRRRPSSLVGPARVAVLTAVLAAASCSPSQALAAASLSWAAPATIDPGQTLNAVACPTRGLCVAVDGAGRVFASAVPAGGALAWTQVASDSSHALSSVSCASVALCAAVDAAGQVLVSSNPNVATNWIPHTIDAGTALTSISCPSESLCVAVDQLGRVFVGEKPTSSSQSWTQVAIDSNHKLDSVSCSSAQQCVAVDDAGSAFASEQPAGGATAWHARDIDAGRALTGVSCGGAGVCVAVDEFGNALASADPASPTPTWSSTSIDPAAASAPSSRAGVSCVSSRLCVAVDGGEAARGSDDPADPTPAWTDARTGFALDGIACSPEGFCAAVSGARVLTASVPVPAAATGTPTAVGQTSASLSGTVNPNDALLGDCRFEYGTSVAYGSSAPCSTLSLAGSVAQPVTAALASLAPGTLYHYRLVALSGAGEGVGADQTFTTVTAALVHPRPTISGVPAVGSRLNCNPGVPAGEPVTLTYEWRRDSSPISAANGSVYRVAKADATHHIQCLATATNAAGSATGHSAFVAIPRQGVLAAVNETTVGRAHGGGERVAVSVRCSPRAAKGCTIALRLSTVRSNRHRRSIAVMVGSSAVRLARGQRRTLTVSLDALGRQLLAHAKHLTVQLSVSGTVIGVLNASLSRQRLALSQPTRGRHR